MEIFDWIIYHIQGVVNSTIDWERMGRRLLVAGTDRGPRGGVVRAERRENWGGWVWNGGERASGGVVACDPLHEGARQVQCVIECNMVL